MTPLSLYTSQFCYFLIQLQKERNIIIINNNNYYYYYYYYNTTVLLHFNCNIKQFVLKHSNGSGNSLRNIFSVVAAKWASAYVVKSTSSPAENKQEIDNNYTVTPQYSSSPWHMQ